MRVERFRARITDNSRGHAVITIPFDPDEAWGAKAVHHVSGTVNGCRVRVTIAPGDSGWAFTLNPARMRHTGIAAGAEVIVELAPEGPQRADLADDISAALAANPAAGAFFDTLAQFYRKAYLRYIDATTRLAGPPRVAYRRGSGPARGRDQRTATAGNTVAGRQADPPGRLWQARNTWTCRLTCPQDARSPQACGL